MMLCILSPRRLALVSAESLIGRHKLHRGAEIATAERRPDEALSRNREAVFRAEIVGAPDSTIDSLMCHKIHKPKHGKDAFLALKLKFLQQIAS
jgi:hypothetical protein